MWPQLLYTDPIPDGGTVAIECSLDDARYFGVRCVVLPDHRTAVTVEFVVDTFDQVLAEVDRLCSTGGVRFAITPTIDLHWPLKLEQKRIVVGYGEILKFTPRIKFHNNSGWISRSEKRFIHTIFEIKIAFGIFDGKENIFR